MADFNLSIAKIFANEGGYQDDSGDQGNLNSLGQLVGTNYGISAPTFEKWIGHPPTADEMKGMQKSTAQTIYENWYWDQYSIGQINDQYLADHILDIFVNSSPGASATIVQKAINDTPPFIETVDGLFGPSTRGTINKITTSGKAEELNSNIVKEREAYYDSLGTGFLSGWDARAEKWLTYEAPQLTSQVADFGTIGIVVFIVFLIYKKK